MKNDDLLLKNDNYRGILGVLNFVGAQHAKNYSFIPAITMAMPSIDDFITRILNPFLEYGHSYKSRSRAIIQVWRHTY
jgi:hypothetical protein